MKNTGVRAQQAEGEVVGFVGFPPPPAKRWFEIGSLNVAYIEKK